MATNLTLPPIPDGFVLEDKQETIPQIPEGFVLEETTPVSRQEQFNIPLTPSEALDIESMRMGRGKAETGMEPGTELTTALASDLQPILEPVSNTVNKTVSYLEPAAKTIGRTMADAGTALRDIAAAYAFELRGEPVLQAQQLGIKPETIKELGMVPEPQEPGVTPIESGMRSLPVVPRIASEAAYGLVETTPQLASTAGLTAIGVPAPIAAGVVFGLTPEGFDAKQGAIAAAIPFVGRIGGKVSQALSKKLGVTSDQAMRLYEVAGGASAATAFLGTIQASEIAALPPEQREDAIVEAIASNIGMLPLFLTGLKPAEKGKQNAATIRTQPESNQPEYTRVSQGENVPENIPEIRQEPSKQTGGSGGNEPSRIIPGGQVAEPVAKAEVTPTVSREIVGATTLPPTMDTARAIVEMAPNEFVKKARGFNKINLEIGRNATLEDIKQLEALKEKANKRLEVALAEAERIGTDEARSNALAIGSMPQFYNEAIAEFYRSHPEIERKPITKAAEPAIATPEQTAKEPFTSQEIQPQPKGGVESETKPQEGRQEVPLTGIESTVAKPATVEPSGQPKEPWQMTQDQFVKRHKEIDAAWQLDKTKPSTMSFGKFYGKDYQKYIDSGKYGEDVSSLTYEQQKHKSEVSNALRKGKPVPQEVLADYPDLKPKAAETPEAIQETEHVGMGAALAKGEPAKPELAQLTDTMKTLANTGKPELNRVYLLSEKWSQWKDQVNAAIDGLRGVSKFAKERLIGLPRWDSFKKALGERQVSLSESALNAKDFVKKSSAGVPKALDREAISNWVDAGGNETILREGLNKTKPKYKPGYERALNLPKHLINIAKNIQNYFESRLQDAIDAGILEDGIENYIHRIYPSSSSWKDGILAELRSGIFTGRPALAKQRVFKYDFEAEQAGYTPIKDFAKRVAAYDMELNKAIADRQFVKNAMQWKMKDGRPAIDAAGVGVTIEGDPSGPLLIKPQYRPKDLADPKNNRSDYVALDHPALRKWKWVGEGADGKPVLIQGNVLVHPDALVQIKALFGRSLVRQNPLGRAALKLGSTVKQTMLDLSAFHPVQITVHGWEHRTFRPLKEINLQDPSQRALVSHGLVAADPHGYELFSEGLSGSSLTRYLPFIGPKLQAYNAWLFQDYIPRLKMAMGLHALERNRSRFEQDLASGKMSEDQLLELTANQANAAFGELNYEMLARNKTTQDILRIALLAPDFLEARGRFAAQAATKYGKEQRSALFLGAATMYITARIINKLLDDQYHFEPRNAFSIVYKKRAYSLRTVQGDVLHVIADPARFTFNRLNPLYGRTALEAVTKRDAFGRTRTGLQQLKDLAQTIVPISFRGVLNPREQKLWESFLNSIGITERRDTSSDEIYRLAEKFKEKNNITHPGEFIYDRDKDPYRGVKLALAYETPEVAAQEMLVLIREGKIEVEKLRSFVNRFATGWFTGSKKNDLKFKSQLSADELATYNSALNERKKMKANAEKALYIVGKNLTAEDLKNSSTTRFVE